MAWADMAFSPVTGLRDTATYAAKPVSETAAREQIQGRLDEVRDYVNASVNKWSIIETKTLVANAAQVDFTSISTDWIFLKLLFTLKSTTDTNRDLNVNFNDNVTANKTTVVSKLLAASITPSGFSADTFFPLPEALPSNSSYPSNGEILINNAASYNSLIANYVVHGVALAGYSVNGVFNGTGHVTKLNLIASGDNIKAGSSFILMGVK